MNLHAVEPLQRDADRLRVENRPRQPDTPAVTGEEQAAAAEVAIQDDAADGRNLGRFECTRCWDRLEALFRESLSLMAEGATGAAPPGWKEG